MIGVDTNILVRLLTNDDKAQAKYAVDLIENNEIFIPKSVLLETEWVLRYTYQLDFKIIHEAFEKLFGLEQVTLEDHICIKKALHWYAHHFDFADALHLASAQNMKFATLDKHFIKKAKKLAIHLMTMPSK